MYLDEQAAIIQFPTHNVHMITAHVQSEGLMSCSSDLHVILDSCRQACRCKL